MITGLSPNTALPTAGNNVKLWRKTFDANDIIAMINTLLMRGATVRHMLRIDTANLMNSTKDTNSVMLPQIAMTR